MIMGLLVILYLFHEFTQVGQRQVFEASELEIQAVKYLGFHSKKLLLNHSS